MDKEALSAVKIALSLEREEADYYRLAASKTQNPRGKKVFQLLAEEEEKHLEALKKQVESVEGKNTWLSDEELFDKLVCKTLKRTKPCDLIPDSPGSDSDGIQALEKAIEIEKKSIEFYERAACDIKHDSASKMFHFLIESEKEHLRELEIQLTFLSSQGIWYDNEVVFS